MRLSRLIVSIVVSSALLVISSTVAFAYFIGPGSGH
jgi:hypothetical protein